MTLYTLCSWQRPSGPNVLHRIELVLRMLLWNSFAVPLELSFCMSLYSHTLYLRMVIGILRIQYIIGDSAVPVLLTHVWLQRATCNWEWKWWDDCSTDSTACSGPHSCYTQPCLSHYITSAPTYICSAHTANIQPCCHIVRTQQSTGGSQKRRHFHLLPIPFTLWLSILNISLVSVPDTPSVSTADTHYTGEWEWSDTQWKWKAIHYNPSKLHFMGFLSFLSLHPWT